MSQTLRELEHLAHEITDLSDRDLHRLTRIIVRLSPDQACDILDGIQAEFSLMERELDLV